MRKFRQAVPLTAQIRAGQPDPTGTLTHGGSPTFRPRRSVFWHNRSADLAEQSALTDLTPGNQRALASTGARGSRHDRNFFNLEGGNVTAPGCRAHGECPLHEPVLTA